MDLQTPSVLAQLPRPLHASTGKTRIGEVYRLADSKKRKRYELAVAVDGEGVNIYNIQTPKLVTSYAVPPQSSFSCQPCSVRRKLSHKVKRQTYVAVNPQKEIKSFVEEHNGSSAPTISSTSFSVKDSDSPTIFVGIIPTVAAEGKEESDPFEILTVHQDGRVRRLTSGLDVQRWSLHHTELAKVSSTREISSCFLVEFEDARKSLFKKRQDIVALALGDLTDSGVDQPSVLLLVSRPKGSKNIDVNEVQVHMFSVPTNVPSQTMNLDESQKMRHLLTVSIPEVEGQGKLPSATLQWDFHSASAGLNLSFDKGFLNFDLSQYSPTVTSKFILENEQFSSVMRISPQSVIGAGSEIIALFDTQYNSIQRSIPVKELPTNGENRKSPAVFIGYFAKLGLAVATKGNALIAFDLSTSRTPAGSSLKRPRDGLLIDAIGRGIASSSPWDPSSKKPRTEFTAALGFTAKEEIEKWNKLSHDLQKSSHSKDAAALDRAVQEYFKDGFPPRDQYINPEVISSIISCIFSLQDTDAVTTDKLSSTPSVRVSVDLWPEATCTWLIERGALSPANAEIVLRRAIKPRILPQLPTGAFAQALIDSDPSFDRLIAVLKGPVLSSPDDLAYALKTFINTARSHYLEDEDAPKALTNGGDPSTTLTTAGPTSLETIFYGLNTTLTKLNFCPLSQLTTIIRSTLSRSEIISLVHHLRLSLATGGYTSRFTENPPTPVSQFQTTPPLSLDVIANLLNAAVDAISPSGWISAGLTDDDSYHSEMELINDLKCEISAALAGIEETTYLKGMLREYLLYTENVQRSLSGKKMSADEERQREETISTLIRHEKLNGADLMVFPSADDLEGYEGDPTGKMLPLSLKAPSNDVSRTKVKKSTGEVKTRSIREIGHLRRKAAGKYAFERLVV
ncbi:hypothetical protein FE257_001512 [Aspergillus nanangensis]|uniref:Utp8 beta-propeller domain-containing protein n=1 Tax=Aspergillus nanangensis TaxID=2582783 RepID=A0AAD4CTG1_ASPNN|nr:hypothetical protein FE257_001512 [Aspergillus nanangensis]